MFSFIDYRLESAPFSYSPSVASLIFILWVFGAVGPGCGQAVGPGWLAPGGVGRGRDGARRVVLTLSGAVPLIVIGLALFAAAMFAGVTACQLGVASSTEHNRGFATAVYFSAYYIAGAFGGYLPGLAWQSWGWGGVGALAIAVLAAGLTALVATAGRSPQRALRATRAELSNGVSSSGISR